MDYFCLTPKKRRRAIQEVEGKEKKEKQTNNNIVVCLSVYDTPTNKKIFGIKGPPTQKLKERIDNFFAGKLNVGSKEALEDWAKKERELIFGQ